MLGRRPPSTTATLTLDRARARRSSASARELDLEVALLSDQQRGRVRRAPAPPARGRRRGGAQPGRLDALQLGDPRRARDRRPARGRGPPLRRHGARGVAAATRCSTASCSAPSPARAPTATARRSSCSSRSSGHERRRRAAPSGSPRSSPSSELDQLIVGDLVRPGDSGPDAIANIRWLTGFTGTSAHGAGRPETRPVHHRLPLRPSAPQKEVEPTRSTA